MEVRENARKEEHFRSEPFYLKVGATNRHGKHMGDPAHTSLVFSLTLSSCPALLHLQRRSSRTQATVNNTLERKIAVVGNRL